MPDDCSAALGSLPSDDLQKTETRIWLRILSLHGTLHARLNRALATDCGLSLAKFEVLAQLHRFEGSLSQGQLSHYLKVTGGNVSGLVRRLVADGLISKEMSATDRRSFVVQLTGKGRTVYEAARKTHQLLLDDCFAGMSVLDLDGALRMLTGLGAAIGKPLVIDR
jgi:DNA-binding MarR family transcriptional regulator